MFKFYLRQTVSFDLSSLPSLVRILLSDRNFSDKKLHAALEKTSTKKYVVLSSSMRSVLLKSLEYFRTNYPEKNEIVLPEYSFHSDLSCVLKAGFIVKFAPTDGKTLLLDSKKLGNFITDKTLGVIITHIHGKVYRDDFFWKIVKQKNILVFEDCAHSFPIDGYSLKEKTFTYPNTIKFLSFGAGKFITAFGGGALATDIKKLKDFVKKSVVDNSTYKDKFFSFVKSCVYVLISNPVFSYFLLKPILAAMYLTVGRKKEDDLFDKSLNKPNEINDMNKFQKQILFFQLTKFKKTIKGVILKRKEVAKEWNNMFNKKTKIDGSDFCFQFPILAVDKDKFIWRMWKKNIDVQEDYCSYLPSLIGKGKISSKKKNYFNQIVYLPTNQYLSLNKIQKLKI